MNRKETGPYLKAVLAVLGLAVLLGCPAPVRSETNAVLDMSTTGVTRETAFLALLTDPGKTSAFVREGLSSDNNRRKLFALSLAVEMGRFDSAPAILALLDDPNPRIRRRAALGLGRLGYGPARLPLEQRLAKRPGTSLARALICGLGLLGRSESIPALLPWLGHPEPLVRVDAAGALGALGDYRGLDQILEGSRDPKPGIRLEAVYGLRFFMNPEAGARLEEMAAAPGGLWRNEAGVSLAARRSAWLKDDPGERENYLSHLLDGPNRMVRRWAVGELGRLGTAEAWEALRAQAEKPTKLGRLALKRLLLGGLAP